MRPILIGLVLPLALFERDAVASSRSGSGRDSGKRLSVLARLSLLALFLALPSPLAEADDPDGETNEGRSYVFSQQRSSPDPLHDWDPRSGNPEILYVRGSFRKIAAGDVAFYAGVPFVLGPPGDYRPQSRSLGEWSVIRNGDAVSGENVLLGLHAYGNEPSQLAEVNDLLRTNGNARTGLWLSRWHENWRSWLEGQDLGSRCLRLGLYDNEGGQVVLPKLPPKLRCLIVDVLSAPDPDLGLAAAKSLPELVVLSVRYSSSIPEDESVFNAKWLAGLPSLRVLEVLSFDRIVNGAEFRAVRELRSLKLAARSAFDLKEINAPPRVERLVLRGAMRSYSRLSDYHALAELDLRGTEFCETAALSKTPSLEFLDLSQSKVSDLAPLATLPDLTYLNISRSAVRDLSAIASSASLDCLLADHLESVNLGGSTFPALSKLSLEMSGVDNARLEHLAQTNSKREIRPAWARKLLGVLSRCDRIVACQQSFTAADGWEPMYETREQKEIQRLLDSIDVVDFASGPHCMCHGNEMIRAYADQTLLAEFTVHHGRSLRWNGWSGDGYLSRESIEKITAWLARHGMPEARDEFERAIDPELDARKQWERERACYRSVLPPGVSRFTLLTDDEQFFSELELACPDPRRRTQILLASLSCDEDWGTYRPFGEAIGRTVRNRSRPESGALAEILEQPLWESPLSDGLLRFWFEFSENTFHHQVPGEILTRLARLGLANPRPEIRERTRSRLDWFCREEAHNGETKPWHGAICELQAQPKEK